METIYDLKLHESIKINDGLLVTRVPGGWIYDIFLGVRFPDIVYRKVNSIFVPLPDGKQFKDGKL